MGRPKRQAGELFYDQFSLFPLDEQAVALRILTELHRQAQRAARRKEQPDAKPGQQIIDTDTDVA